MLTVLNKLSRRSLFERGGILAAFGLLPRLHAAPAATKLAVGPTIYESIGVRPIVNCRGTYTILSGSQSLPEVKRAMEEASRHYVQMDELMEGVSARLAEITKAEWGIVTSGCASAITNATAACIAGSDPEKMQRLPDLTGLKSEVIMPRHSRNVYDHAARMLGVKIVEVDTAEQLEKAITEKTAMILIYSSPAAERGPLTVESISRIAKPHGVPVLVDAAAETLTIPNIHLQHGATMVAYSGGKCLRGPQCAGLLLGPKNLLKAAWGNSAPHHAFGRSLKVGKEEIMGMLAAVEMWVKRDHDAEWKTWETWLAHISDQVTKVPGVTTAVLQPEDLSNHAPMLEIKWDGDKVGITGREVEKLMLDGKPRIAVGGSSGMRPDSMASSLTIMPYMMMPEDHKIAADALYALLSKPPKIEPRPRPSGEPAQIAGQWSLHIEYLVGSADHNLIIEQSGRKLSGTHQSDILTGDLSGAMAANEASFSSSHRIQGTSIEYAFTGTVDGDTMSGTVSLGEYGPAKWTAHRHRYA
jgi:uncharacterized pyridoxal phosphate-dependent enzyme